MNVMYIFRMCFFQIQSIYSGNSDTTLTMFDDTGLGSLMSARKRNKQLNKNILAEGLWQRCENRTKQVISDMLEPRHRDRVWKQSQ